MLTMLLSVVLCHLCVTAMVVCRRLNDISLPKGCGHRAAIQEAAAALSHTRNARIEARYIIESSPI